MIVFYQDNSPSFQSGVGRLSLRLNARINPRIRPRIDPRINSNGSQPNQSSSRVRSVDYFSVNQLRQISLTFKARNLLACCKQLKVLRWSKWGHSRKSRSPKVNSESIPKNTTTWRLGVATWLTAQLIGERKPCLHLTTKIQVRRRPLMSSWEREFSSADSPSLVNSQLVASL